MFSYKLSGTTVYSKVYATDGVGWTSSIVLSDGVIIDTIPPVPETLYQFDKNLLLNPSFEETGGNEVNWENVSSTDICTVSNTYHPSTWLLGDYSCMAVVTSLSNLAKDGSNFLFFRGSLSQNLENVTSGKFYRISFFSSHLMIKDSSAANKGGYVQLGDGNTHVFLVYTKGYRYDRHDSSREDISWHAHTFFIRADQTNVTFTIGSTDITTGIFIDDLSVQQVNLRTGDGSGHVLGHVVYLHDWSSIHGSWSFIDTVSPIIDYQWAIGSYISFHFLNLYNSINIH